MPSKNNHKKHTWLFTYFCSIRLKCNIRKWFEQILSLYENKLGLVFLICSLKHKDLHNLFTNTLNILNIFFKITKTGRKRKQKNITIKSSRKVGHVLTRFTLHQNHKSTMSYIQSRGLILFNQTAITQKKRELIRENGIPPKNNKLIIRKFQT